MGSGDAKFESLDIVMFSGKECAWNARGTDFNDHDPRGFKVWGNEEEWIQSMMCLPTSLLDGIHDFGPNVNILNHPLQQKL